MRRSLVFSCALFVLTFSFAIAAQRDEGTEREQEISLLRDQVRIIQQQIAALEQKLNALESTGAESSATTPRVDSSEAEDRIQTETSIDERLSSLQSLIQNTRIGAWVDFLYRDTSKKGATRFFDPQHFYFFLDNRLSSRWRSFAEVEFEHSPLVTDSGAQGQISLERTYIEYTHNDFSRFR
ncbi:MAG: hypothetical protein IH919_03050, partial [Deltaproteobacteria bacterium]|nr:hypothetical protein [Deltaproteobacteria bacterium]